MIDSWGTKAQEFFFRPVAATPLALLRIAVGALTTIWSVTLIGDVDPLLTWLRVNPNSEIGWWQFWPTASPSVVMAMVWMLAAASVLLTAGWWTKVSSWSVFFLMLVIQRYDPAAFNGGDYILRGVLLLGLGLSPAGAYLSVDAWRKRQLSLWQAPLVVPWGLRFMQLHISLGYILTVILKLRGTTWVGGTAIWYAVGLEDLVRFDVPDGIAAPPVGAVLTWIALMIELAVGVGVWFRRTRPWVLLAGIALHLGIALVFEIGFFSYVMMASYLAFVSPAPDVRVLITDRWRSKLAARKPSLGGLETGRV